MDRDLVRLSVPLVGRLRAQGARVGRAGSLMPGARLWRRCRRSSTSCRRAGRSASTLRSYGMDLLRWFRFIWAIDVDWNRASRVDARDFARWMLVAGKPQRSHWRRPDESVRRWSKPVPYSPAVRAHSETVLRRFWETRPRSLLI